MKEDTGQILIVDKIVNNFLRSFNNFKLYFLKQRKHTAVNFVQQHICLHDLRSVNRFILTFTKPDSFPYGNMSEK